MRFTPILALLVAGTGAAQELPLRRDSIPAVVADLEKFIADEMVRGRIPGVGIALLRNHRIVWQRGFGVANSITRDTVGTTTAFPVASLGKPVAAYAALRLATRGLLSLDLPLEGQLGTPWLRAAHTQTPITLRHLLTHTSGLSNFLGDRARLTRFTPGSRYSYSGVGFMYAQRGIEEVGGSLDSAARVYVFAASGMERSSFVGRPSKPGHEAAGHVRADRAIIPFAILFFPLTSLLLVLVAVASRVMCRDWRPPAWAVITAPLTAAASTAWFLFSRAANPRLVPFFIGAFLAFAVAAGLLALGVAAVVQRSIGTRLPRPVTLTFKLLAGTSAVVLLFVGIARARIPVPDGTSPEGNAASSLRASAGDLARFLIAAADPSNGDSLSREFARDQVRVSEHIGWGLGMGIQHSNEGDALFHWGRNPALRAAMVIYRESGNGVVVLANDGQAGDAVAEITLRAIGGPRYWIDE